MAIWISHYNFKLRCAQHNKNYTLTWVDDQILAKQQGGWVFVPKDLNTREVWQHEIIHGFVDDNPRRNRAWATIAENNDYIFQHASKSVYENIELRGNEDITMLLSSFNKDKKIWAKAMADNYMEMSEDILLKKVNDFSLFMKDYGIDL